MQCNISPASQVGSGEDLDLVALEHVADLKMKEFNYSTTHNKILTDLNIFILVLILHNYEAAAKK
jgi:hypothetical protein